MRDARVVRRSVFANLIERALPGDSFRRWTREGRSFGIFASKAFSRSTLQAGDVVIGYTAANLEQLMLAKERGAKALHVQVDPGLAWYETRRQEHTLYPEVEEAAPMPSVEFIERIGREWLEAERVVTHSEHSRAAMIAQGVPPSRCVVIPPAFKSLSTCPARRLDQTRPLRVLFVGNHCLAKGYHIFVEAARQAGPRFKFISAGRHTLRPAYLAKASNYVTILGVKTQAGVRLEMDRADVLVFPTLSDGFGLVQLEAMASGLPVIATAACGEVVKDGINGRVVPLRDPAAIVAALHDLRVDHSMYERFSLAAIRRTEDFSPEKHFFAMMAL